MFTICARIDSKKSDGNFGSNAVGIIVTAEHLELKSPAEVAAKADELFRMAREAVERQVGGDSAAKAPEPQPAPSNGNGTGNGRRTYGRPAISPSDKQKGLLAKLVRERNLPPETIRQICERVAGCRLEQLDRKGFSLLLENLMSEAVTK